MDRWKRCKPPSFVVRGLFAIAVLGCPAAFSAAADTNSRDMVLWYRQPAQQWLQAMPLGNGMIGAMVFGGVPQERIALNESSFWSGRPHDYDDTNAFQYFPQIRDLVFADKFQEAEKMANEHFWGKPKSQEAYQPIGDLLLDFGTTNYTGYRRELDMETGVAKITYRQGDAVITRETFVSWPDRVLVMRISADRPGRISFGVQFRSLYMVTNIARSPFVGMVMDGTWKGPFSAPATGMNGLIARTEGEGLRFKAVMMARQEGGQSEGADSFRNITNADSVTLVLALATSFVNYHDISGNPAARCQKILDAVADKDFATLLRRHVDDFRGLMGRVHLNVGDAALGATPDRPAPAGCARRRERPQSRSALLPVRPVYPGLQQPRRRSAGQSARHLE